MSRIKKKLLFKKNVILSLSYYRLISDKNTIIKQKKNHISINDFITTKTNTHTLLQHQTLIKAQIKKKIACLI